jgi:hypothetical protein
MRFILSVLLSLALTGITLLTISAACAPSVPASAATGSPANARAREPATDHRWSARTLWLGDLKVDAAIGIRHWITT